MFTKALAVVALALSLTAGATVHPQITKTDWLQDQVGSTGEVMGAKVVAVKNDKDYRLIDVEIPQFNRFDTQEVIVEIFSADEKPHEKRTAKYKHILLDKNGKPSGLQLRLKKRKALDFRLYLRELSEPK